MTDKTSDFKPLDPGRINTMDPVELQYWCQALQCTRQQLDEALAQVGDHVSAVRKHLSAKPR
jgi:hypothetical protein